MKPTPSLLFALLASALVLPVEGHDVETHYRTPIHIPDISGYVTLKCDFHIHTVFSDGLVWPSVRAEEAWREGLDAIAITDHIEYHPHKADVTDDLNRSSQLARNAGNDLNLIVINGAEITRGMPPGHLNAIFLTNATPLNTPKWTDAVDAAHAQGAFIFWNHPGWDQQTTNGVVVWYEEHTRLLKEGKLQGIEVVNTRDYYPEAHRWAIEKKLTMLGNSDIHNPINLEYEVRSGDHRPLTLVFAKERTAAAIREALFDRRTAVYSGNRLIGEEQFLRPIFEKSITFDSPKITLKKRKALLVQISNSSDVDYELELVDQNNLVEAPQKLILLGQKTVLMELRATSAATIGVKTLKYNVTNLLVAPNKPLLVTLPLEINVSETAKPAR